MDSSRHAIVIGGSMAGLLATRVLSDHFGRVTLIERDMMPDEPLARKGQPQARHLHWLLAQGFRIVSQYFPDLPQALADGGAVLEDVGERMHWFTHGGYRAQFTFGSPNVFVSRPYLEWQIRKRVLALPQVTLRQGYAVEQLAANDDRSRVIGVVMSARDAARQPETLMADLVVDASGRGSHTPQWLEALGYERPPEDTVRCGVGYASRVFRRDISAAGSRDWFAIGEQIPIGRRGGAAFPVEGDRWIVTLGGYHGDHPPDDEAGFQEFARSLPRDDVYRIVSQCEPLSDIVLHKFPASQRRRYERLLRFPQRLLVLGDALCSFNPLYGQGMTVTALEARTFDDLLGERNGDLEQIAPIFLQRMAHVIDIPWKMAIGEDFRFSETEGYKAPGTDLMNAYGTLIHRASLRDPVVGRAFLRVTNLVEPPTSLFRPQIVWRVLRANVARGKTLPTRAAT